MNASTLVQKLWNYCNVLRDDGMSYGDYVEQLTFLLFLKMADERSQPPYNQTSIVPAAYAWPTLLGRDGDALFDHYRHALEKLGQEDRAQAVFREIIASVEGAPRHYRSRQGEWLKIAKQHLK